jgi:hypothetical protein
MSLARNMSAYWAKPIPRSQPSMSNFNPLGRCQRQFLKKGCVTGARRDSKGFLESTWIRHVDASYSTTA